MNWSTKSLAAAMGGADLGCWTSEEVAGYALGLVGLAQGTSWTIGQAYDAAAVPSFVWSRLTERHPAPPPANVLDLLEAPPAEVVAARRADLDLLRRSVLTAAGIALCDAPS